MIRTISSLLLFAFSVSAQVEFQRPYSVTAPQFYFDVLNFRSSIYKSRIDLYFQIPYSRLHFMRDGSDFVSSYEIRARLIDKNRAVAHEESWEETEITRGFDETTSDFILSSCQRHFIVDPGSYTLFLTVHQPESGDSFSESCEVAARDFSSPSASISDIMILLTASRTGEKRTIVPNIRRNVYSQSDSFQVFFEVYPAGSSDSLYITTEVLGSQDKAVYSNSRRVKSVLPVTRVFQELPKTSLAMGHYKIRVLLRGPDNEGNPVMAASSRAFSIYFPDLPPTVTDLDEAAEQMIFITGSSTIDSIKSETDPTAKEKKFLGFWRHYRSKFSTDSRVLMEEYYSRVAYSNENFAHFFPGWKSDRGMIYILFGPPDEVERYPFNIDSKPYEIWQYYRKSRKFLFVDETGLGDYRLYTPVWDSNSPLSGMDFVR